MAFETKTIDGLDVVVPVTGVVGATGWEASKDAMINLMALGESPNYFYDDFADADNATGDNFEHDAVSKCLKNSVTAASPGVNLVPPLNAASTDDWEASISSVFSTHPAFHAFDRDSNTFWNSNGLPNWLQIQKKTGDAMEVTGVSIRIGGGSTALLGAPKDFKIQTSNDGVNWVDQIEIVGEPAWTLSEKRTYMFPDMVTAEYVRIYNSVTQASNIYTTFIEVELLATATPAVANSATITLDNYVPVTMPEKCKLKLWLENVDDGSIAPDLGNSGSNKIECYLSTDGGSTFGSALNFTQGELQPASNINVFDSGEIDLSGASGIQIKLQSFNRGDAAPNFAWHAALALEKTEAE